MLGLAVSPCCTATRGSSRDAGVTHRRQGAADDSLCGRDEARQARKRKFLADFQTNGPDNHRQQKNADVFDHGYFAPFALKRLGLSSRSGTWSAVNFLASAGISNLKASDA